MNPHSALIISSVLYEQSWCSLVLRAASTVIISIVLPMAGMTAEPSGIGSGNPGLKVATRMTNTSAIVIYQDEPYTVGAGMLGGMKGRTVSVIIDRGFHFQKDSIEIPPTIPQQLYPFDGDSAFTSEIGAKDPEAKEATAHGFVPPWPVGYRLVNGKLITFTNVQKEAEVKYHLNTNEIFLGSIENKIFFCKMGFNPAVVYWRNQDDHKEYSYAMPRGVVDIYGVTKGIKGDVGFVVLHKAKWRLHPAPYEDDFIEVNLSNGKR